MSGTSAAWSTLLCSVALGSTPASGRLVIDAVLGGRPRPFGRFPGTISGGPTGARLWANFLNEGPGLMGRFHFIHALNAPGLLEFQFDTPTGPVIWETPVHQWFPSHLYVRHCAANAALLLEETKWCTWDDCGVCTLRLTNTGATPVTVRLTLRSPVATIRTRHGLCGEHEAFSTTLAFVAGASKAELLDGWSCHLAPGETWKEVAGCAVALEHEQVAQARLANHLHNPDPLATQRSEYQAWFDRVPHWQSSCPEIDKVWAYRWYLARRNLADPRYGRLSKPLFYEGRGHKLSPEPYRPEGWDFSKLISFAACWHVLENRWYPDLAPVRGEVENLVAAQQADGRFGSCTVEKAWGYYNDLVAWAVWQLHQVAPDTVWLEDIIDGLCRSVDAWSGRADPDRDGLPTITQHGTTGKEFQPSFFEAAGFPCSTHDAEPLERVDTACYLCANARAVARLLRVLGNNQSAEHYDAVADKTAQAVRDHMWDPQQRFFFDLRDRTGTRTASFNVVGFDPFFAGIADDEHEAALDHLLDPRKFWAPFPVPSTAMDGPAFAPHAWWFDAHPKGRHGAMWNGPTWPYTNTTVLYSLATATRRFDHRYDPVFADLFLRYTCLHFRNGNLEDPCLVEHYRPDTGEPISQEEDYYHSGWIDLVVTAICGLVPQASDRVQLDPVDCGLDWFVLRGLPYRGRQLDISWNRNEGSQPDLRAGLSLAVDGRLTAHRSTWGPLVADLP